MNRAFIAIAMAAIGATEFDVASVKQNQSDHRTARSNAFLLVPDAFAGRRG